MSHITRGNQESKDWYAEQTSIVQNKEIKKLELKIRQLKVEFTNYRLRDNEGFAKLKDENKKLKAFIDCRLKALEQDRS